MHKQAADSTSKQVASRLILFQIAITLISSLTGFIIDGVHMAYSAGLGGSIAVIGTILMATITFAATDLSPKQLLFALYLGEASKVLVTIGLFIGVFMFFDVNVWALMLTYIAALMVHWLCLLTGY